jgi:O-antigen ligase
MTQSRGNIALLPAAALIFCLQRKKYGAAAAIGIGAPLMAGLLMASARISPQIAAFLNVGGAATSSQLTTGVYDYRQLLLQRGMEVASMHRWTGASMNDVLDQLSDIAQGQGIVDMVNTYLTLYLVSGLAGMLPLLLLLAMIWWKLVTARTSRLGSPELADMRGFALTALTVVTVQLAFMSFIDRLPLCIAIALVAARMVGIERRRIERAGKAKRGNAEAGVQPEVQVQPAPRPRRIGRPAPLQR